MNGVPEVKQWKEARASATPVLQLCTGDNKNLIGAGSGSSGTQSGFCRG
jgi:hypothetical protein